MSERALPVWVQHRAHASRVGVSVDVGPSLPSGGGGSPPLMKPGGTGAVITESDVERYIGLLDPLIRSLGNDIEANLVYYDPAYLDDVAKALDVAYAHEQAQETRDEAAMLRKRAASRSPEKVAREIAFSKEWHAFTPKWTKDKTCGVSDGCIWQSDRWNKIESDDVAFQGYHRNYQAMGYTPTLGLPPPPSSPGGFPWTALLWITAIGVGGYFLAQVWHFLPARSP